MTHEHASMHATCRFQPRALTAALTTDIPSVSVAASFEHVKLVRHAVKLVLRLDASGVRDVDRRVSVAVELNDRRVAAAESCGQSRDDSPADGGHFI